MGKSHRQKPHRHQAAKPIPFDDSHEEPSDHSDRGGPEHLLPASVGQIHTTLDSMSRSIKDLARELNCLGFFDDDDDRPRAA
ncbi:MAG: hypothetical protein JSV91_10690 [Phycisphaerales bacterium]|nr:MAG: hypothetical protein JSV91_10690 [Phycisphaerales bacterium]